MDRMLRMTVLFALLTLCLWAGESRADRIVACESEEQRYLRCPADTRGGVTLDDQLSDSPCRFNVTWGYDRNGIWVDKGCRAKFRIGEWSDAGMVICESEDQRHRRCPADTKGGVTLVDQLSDSPCRLNDTWGYDRKGIWVDKGCRAKFKVGGWGGKQTVTCESDNQRHKLCPVNTAGGVTLVEQLSDSPCRFSDTWGFDRKGIWVDRGCRAKFSIGFSGSGWQSEDEAVSLCRGAITDKVLGSVDRRAALEFDVVDARVLNNKTFVEGKGIVRVGDRADKILFTCTVDKRTNRVTESNWQQDY